MQVAQYFLVEERMLSLDWSDDCPACAVWRGDDIFRICVAVHCASRSNQNIFTAGRMR